MPKNWSFYAPHQVAVCLFSVYLCFCMSVCLFVCLHISPQMLTVPPVTFNLCKARCSCLVCIVLLCNTLKWPQQWPPRKPSLWRCNPRWPQEGFRKSYLVYIFITYNYWIRNVVDETAAVVMKIVIKRTGRPYMSVWRSDTGNTILWRIQHIQNVNKQQRLMKFLRKFYTDVLSVR